MRPIRLELHNVLQHVNTGMDYMYGITGVTAPNGTGKSNLVDPGQYFAISGKTIGDKTKGDMLHWNAEKGHTLFVFEHEGKKYTLKRNVHNAGVSLKADGDKKGMSGAEANAFMEAAIGMSFDRFYEVCWASQGQLTDILTATHAKRVAFFQRLVDVRRAEVLRGIINENGLAKLPEYPDRTNTIQEMKECLVDLDKNIGQMENVYKDLTETEAAYKTLLESSRSILALPTEAEKQRRIAEIDNQLNVARQRLETFSTNNQIVEVAPVEPITQQQQDMAFKYSRYVADQALLDQKQLVYANVSQTTLSEVPEPDLSAYEALTKSLAEDQPKLAMYRTATCPTCERPFTFDISEEDRQAFIADYEERLKQSYTMRVELQRQKEAYSSYCSDKARLDAQVKALSDELQEIARRVAVKPEFDKEAYDKQVADYAVYCEFIKNKEQHKAQLDNYQREIDRCVNQLSDAQAIKASTEVEVEQAKAFEKMFEDMQVKIREAGMEKAGAIARREETHRVLMEYEAEQKKRMKCLGLRRLFERCREVLHRDSLPRVVMRDALYGLNTLLGNYLSLFDTNFTAKINNDMDFVCTFEEKADVRASALSWGQAIALGIAFKFAISDLMASKIPLLVLDEPTPFLDDTNIKCVGDVLKKAKGLTEQGVFLQVATHEAELLSSFSRILDVADMK